MPYSHESAERPGGVRDLAQFIPGGLFCCLWDEALTLVEMSEGFLRLLGYTRQEIARQYRNSFRAMIDPRDWDATLDRVLQQMALGPEKELEYRMRRKDGATIWVLDKGNLVRTADGQDAFYCLLVDITASKQVQEELRLSLERHRIILDQSNDIIVEWDLDRDQFTYSANWQKKFGYEPLQRNVSRDVRSLSHIHPDDVPAFSGMLEALRQGTPYAEVEMRLKETNRHYRWCRVRFTAQCDDAGRAIKAVGVILDIDEEKRRAQELLDLAQKDTLTGLYNKGAARDRIAQALEAGNGGAAALLLIDVDNFKAVNDTMGHLFGDEFLVGISQELSRLFREEDIVGRIGGDEFLALMRHLPGSDVALARAEQVLEVFRRESGRAGLPDIASCSIGIAMAPRQGADFNALFHAADLALYRAKQQGKNCCCLYSPACAEGFPASAGREAPTALGSAIDSNKAAGHSLSDRIFRALYGDADIQRSIPAVLGLIGRHFDVSRVYIFETSEDGRYLSNTFEWCGEGVEPQIDSLQRLSWDGELGGRLPELFNEDGIFYCRDISVLPPGQYELLARQGICSMLQCAILDSGAFQGLVGFDECRANRYWKQDQIDALTLLSEIVGTFLLKHRARERAERTAREMRSLLESQSAWVYVIRPETHELLYINHRIAELTPGVVPGMRCHEVFFGCGAPCEQCPAQKVREGAQECFMRLYNPHLQVWASADARRLLWRGEEAILLTCHDITALMPPDAPD